MRAPGNPPGDLGDDALGAAVCALRRGGVVAAPTETFVGLLCDIGFAGTLDRLVRLKGRPAGRPFPLLVPDAGSVAPLVVRIPAPASRAMAVFWPGPVTLLLPARPGLPVVLVGEGGSVAVRVAGASPAASLCRLHGAPLTATSANASGEPPATDSADLDPGIRSGVDVVVPGRSPGGLPSTIIAFEGDGYRIVREGAVPAAAIRGTLG